MCLDNIWAQDIVNDNITINYNSAEKYSHTRKILSILALGNNKDLKQLQLDYKCKFSLNPTTLTNGKIKLQILPGEINIEGDYYYRSFDLSSNLIPSYYLINLLVLKDGYELYNEDIIVPRGGKNMVLETNKRVFSLANTQFVIEIDNVSFAKNDYKYLDEIVEKVNYYYGFGELLKQLNQKQKVSSSLNTLQASKVFLLWQESSRVDAYINDIGFIESLDLANNDPDNFNDKYVIFQRFKRRWKTLADQKFKRELKKGFLEDKENYIKSLLRLSETYYEESLKKQPYEATSFRKLSELLAISDMEIINKVFYYYDALSYGDNITVPKQLYSGFVSLGDDYFKQSKNTMALSMLKNARILQEYFKLQASDLYTITMAATLNGMIESYLKVSTKAVERANLRFAENYFREAENVYEENKNLFEDSGIAVTPFLIYIDAQKKKAIELADNNEFVKSDEVIVICFITADEKNLKKDSTLIELQKIVRKNIYLEKLKLVSENIDDNNIFGAYELLAEADKYRENNKDIISNKSNFTDLAYSVFLEYLQKGEILLDKSYIDMAYDNLLIAKKIQSKYLNYKVEKLDELLKSYAQPKILELCEQARLETWAKRNQNAHKLLDSALAIQQTYKQQNNPVVNKTINDLIGKMQSRHCIEAKFKISENNKSFVANIASGEIENAYKKIKNSYEIAENNDDCIIDMHITDSLINEYSYVLDFKQAYDNMKLKLFEKGYYEVIDEYLKLRQFYFKYNISSLNFNLPPLNEFVKQQNLTKLSISSVEYFIDKEQYQLAFEYLKILNSQGVEAKQTKDIQIKLAEAWRNSDSFNKDQINEMLEDIGKGQEWYKYFRRVINGKYIIFLKN